MKTNLLLTFASTFAFALAGCSSSPATDDAASSSQDISASWFATHIPHGSSEEKAVLELVNDPNMSQSEYVNECGFSQSVAAAIINFRQGDEAATALDDQEFKSIAQIDALPFTDQGFWNSALQCSSIYTPPTTTCTSWPGSSGSPGGTVCCTGTTGSTGSTSSSGWGGTTTGSTGSGPVIVGTSGGTTGGTSGTTTTGPNCYPYPSTSSSSSGGWGGTTTTGGTTTSHP